MLSSRLLRDPDGETWRRHKLSVRGHDDTFGCVRNIEYATRFFSIFLPDRVTCIQVALFVVLSSASWLALDV